MIFSYTEDDAVADGTLKHPYPARWPWLLVSLGVDAACRSQPGRAYDECLVPLLMDTIMLVQSKRGREIDWPLVLEGTVAGKVWINPNGKGGLTVMTPSEY